MSEAAETSATSWPRRKEEKASRPARAATRASTVNARRRRHATVNGMGTVDMRCGRGRAGRRRRHAPGPRRGAQGRKQARAKRSHDERWPRSPADELPGLKARGAAGRPTRRPSRSWSRPPGPSRHRPRQRRAVDVPRPARRTRRGSLREPPAAAERVAARSAGTSGRPCPVCGDDERDAATIAEGRGAATRRVPERAGVSRPLPRPRGR